MERQNKNVSLPDNAYRELKAGEEYKPLMSAESTPAEVTSFLYSLLLKTFGNSHQFILMLRQTLSQRPHKFR